MLEHVIAALRRQRLGIACHGDAAFLTLVALRSLTGGGNNAVMWRQWMRNLSFSNAIQSMSASGHTRNGLHYCWPRLRVARLRRAC